MLLVVVDSYGSSILHLSIWLGHNNDIQLENDKYLLDDVGFLVLV